MKKSVFLKKMGLQGQGEFNSLYFLFSVSARSCAPTIVHILSLLPNNSPVTGIYLSVLAHSVFLSPSCSIHNIGSYHVDNSRWTAPYLYLTIPTKLHLWKRINKTRKYIHPISDEGFCKPAAFL